MKSCHNSWNLFLHFFKDPVKLLLGFKIFKRVLKGWFPEGKIVLIHQVLIFNDAAILLRNQYFLLAPFDTVIHIGEKLNQAEDEAFKEPEQTDGNQNQNNKKIIEQR